MSNEEKYEPSSGQPESRSTPEIRYVPIEYLQAIQDDEDRIDLFELIKTVWNGRWLIVKTVVIFIFLGLFVALASINEYTSEVRLLPETQQSSGLGALGGLASQFGFSSGPDLSADGIPPTLYPDIIQSTVFLKHLMAHEVYLPDNAEKITIEEYFKEHQKVSNVNNVKSYTIGLPFTILGWLRSGGGDEEVTDPYSQFAGDERIERLIRMSGEDWAHLRNLRDRISSLTNYETGIVTVEVKMQDAMIAADLANRVVELLSEYVTDYRTEKYRRDVEFIKERHEEAKIRFEEAQQELALFNDTNSGRLSAMARTEEQLLQNNFNLTFNLYNTLAERLEEARIKLQEETPVVNILEPAAVPNRRSEPNRVQLMILYTIFGGIVGVGLIFGIQIWQKITLKLKH